MAEVTLASRCREGRREGGGGDLLLFRVRRCLAPHSPPAKELRAWAQVGAFAIPEERGRRGRGAVGCLQGPLVRTPRDLVAGADGECGRGGMCGRVPAWWTVLRQGRALRRPSASKCCRTRDGRHASWLCPKAPGDQSLRELGTSRPRGLARELPALHPHAPP